MVKTIAQSDIKKYNYRYCLPQNSPKITTQKSLVEAEQTECLRTGPKTAKTNSLILKP